MADRSEKFVLMSLGAIKIQELLKDKFDYRSQGYCPQHKCFIAEGPDGDSNCPGFLGKLHSLEYKEGKYRMLTKEEEAKFDFGSPEDCQWNKKWIGLPNQKQLQEQIIHRYPGYLTMFEVFILFLRTDYILKYVSKNFGSPEQFWLMFLQKELHDEIWDDKKQKWVKENE